MKPKKAFDKSAALAAIVLVGFCLSLIPILYAGFFAHPFADDYSFSYRVNHAVMNRSSLLKAIAETVTNTYITWQGTFSAVVFFSIQPAAFSSSFYCFTAFIMVGFLTFSTFFLFETIIKRILHGKTSHVIIISCLTLAMSIQYVPNIHEAFYWFNGSAFYTLFYSLSLIYLTLLLRLRITESSKKRTIYFIISLLFGVIVGGGNYSTALITAELVFLLTLLEFYQKSHNKWQYFIILFIYMAAFIINIIAPGNAIRAKKVISLNPIMAIAQSLSYALGMICEWTRVPQMIYIASVFMLSAFLVPNCSIKFNRPILPIGLAFLLFASQMTPPLYAMSNLGSGRQIDIYYYSYYLLIAFSFFYLCGWLYQRMIELNEQSASSRYLGFEVLVRKHIWAITIILCVIMGANSYEQGLLNMTSFQTTKAIMDGTLIKYNQEYNAIEDQLESGVDILELSDIETVPPFFSNLGLSEDPEFWINKAIARYYGIESIQKRPEQSVFGRQK